MSVTLKQTVTYAALAWSAVVSAACVTAYAATRPSDDQKYTNTGKDVCWNIPHWQSSIPAGQVLVGDAYSTVAMASAEDMAKDPDEVWQSVIRYGYHYCTTPAIVRANLNRANGRGQASGS